MNRILFHFLTEHKNLQKVYLCLDHDEAGQKANKRIGDRLIGQGAKYEILVPIHKDWNEDLLYLRDMQKKKPKTEMKNSKNVIDRAERVGINRSENSDGRMEKAGVNHSNNSDDRTEKTGINCGKNSDSGTREYIESTTILNRETEAASCQILQF